MGYPFEGATCAQEVDFPGLKKTVQGCQSKFIGVFVSLVKGDDDRLPDNEAAKTLADSSTGSRCTCTTTRPAASPCAAGSRPRAPSSGGTGPRPTKAASGRMVCNVYVERSFGAGLKKQDTES
ncbi:hypothetical protein PG993_015261 [Apiospora rasikravindrae]|uniref:Uncharacterized protein n=1 Tax=Apiospora rasikravindrae TaxID=990691 RepID=A0ABR1RQA6_9PEZI